MLVDETDAEAFNYFLYWRRPPINLDGAAPVAEEEEQHDDMRWRRRPGNLVGSLFSRGEPLDPGVPGTADQSASVSTVSSPDPYSGQPEDDGEHGEHGEHARLVDIEGHHDHTTLVDMEEEEEEEPEDDDLALLRGGAGARLLAVLGQLSQHLGPQSRCAWPRPTCCGTTRSRLVSTFILTPTFILSLTPTPTPTPPRFSVASNMLQNDLQQMRASNTDEDEEYEAQHESDESDDAIPSQLRLPSSSALQEPQARLCPPTPSLAAAIPPCLPSRSLQPPP